MVHLLPEVVLDLPVTDLFSFVWKSIPSDRLHKRAFIDGLTGDAITFHQLQQDSLAFARGIRDPSQTWGGLKRYQIACLFGTNCLALPGIIYGLLAAGGGLTPSNPSYTARELAHQLRSSKSALLICQSDVLPIALEAATEVGLAHSRIILMDDKTPGFISVSQIVQRGYQLTEEQVGGSIVYSQDDIKKVPALLPFSSGTTGNPKGVALTHYNLTSNLIQWTTHDGRAGEKVPEGEVQPCFIPLFHMAGFMTYMMIAPRIGAAVAIYPRFDLHQALEAWQKYKTRYLSLVPPIAVVLAKADLSGYKFNVDYIMCGSAPLGPELEAVITSKFNNVGVTQGYGCTECTCAGTIYPKGRKSIPGAVGTPIPNMEVKVVDPETGELSGFNKEGELWLKGPNIALGYFGNEEATKASFTPDGFYKTGDLVVCDENRNFWIRDRLKELIKYNAFQIAPAELEDLLMRHPDVLDVCVIGLPHESSGEVPKAFVVVKPNVPKTQEKADEIRAFLDGLVTPYKRLRGGLEFREVIPRGATGKILRRAIRDEVRAEMAKQGGAKL